MQAAALEMPAAAENRAAVTCASGECGCTRLRTWSPPFHLHFLPKMTSRSRLSCSRLMLD